MVTIYAHRMMNGGFTIERHRRPYINSVADRRTPTMSCNDIMVADGLTNGIVALAVPLSMVAAYMMGIACTWSAPAALTCTARHVRLRARQLQVLATACSTVLSLTLLALAALSVARWGQQPDAGGCMDADALEWFVYLCTIDLTVGTAYEWILLWTMGIDVQAYEVHGDDCNTAEREAFRRRKLPALMLLTVILAPPLKGSSVLVATAIDPDPPGRGWAHDASVWAQRGTAVVTVMVYCSVRVLVLDLSRGWHAVRLKAPAYRPLPPPPTTMTTTQSPLTTTPPPQPLHGDGIHVVDGSSDDDEED
mgnify:CR=1 FL=1